MPTRTKEFGDFQTPPELASEVVSFLKSAKVNPTVIVEPTCGAGNFVHAAIDQFPTIREIYAYDINADYIAPLRGKLRGPKVPRCEIKAKNFFTFDWKSLFDGLEGEVLVLGNPPWVTSSALGALGSGNLPEKSNFQNHAGFSAKTGKANFDISEWILIKLLESLGHRRATLAMLCKTATARKVLRHSWVHGFPIGPSAIHSIDAGQSFGVAVDACLLCVKTGHRGRACVAGVYADLSEDQKKPTIGIVGKDIVSDLDAYKELRDLEGHSQYKWRSGIKHDAASVMELVKNGGSFVNGLGEHVRLEPKFIYPLLKSSDLANGRLSTGRFVVVTQQSPKDDTSAVELDAPLTWKYLSSHAKALDSRRSIIYRNRPRFSVFGIGPYAFAPWKVAVSGLYKNLVFRVVSEVDGKPCMVDDTCYFLSCRSLAEAEFLSTVLNSDIAQRYLRALVFPDAKRPVTVDVLNRLDIVRIAQRLGLQDQAQRFVPKANSFEGKQGLLFLEEQSRYRRTVAPRKSSRGK